MQHAIWKKKKERKNSEDCKNWTRLLAESSLAVKLYFKIKYVQIGPECSCFTR